MLHAHFPFTCTIPLDMHALRGVLCGRSSKLNGNELAAIVYGLARLQHQPSDAWLERALEVFRAAMRFSATPPSLVKFLSGAAQLQVTRARGLGGEFELGRMATCTSPGLCHFR